MRPNEPKKENIEKYLPIKPGVILVDSWVPKEKDKIVKYDGKLIIIEFDKIFNIKDMDLLNTFVIKKESYVTILDTITKYINYFIKFYDKKSLLIENYIRIKYLIDDNKITTKEKFINVIYGALFTPELVQYISNMVEDNYYLDISSDPGTKKYNEQLEFTNDHAKIMMKISTAIKIMCPLLFHFIYVNNIQKTYNYLFEYYYKLFDLFNEKGIDIYNKLYVYTKARVNVDYINNKRLWEIRDGHELRSGYGSDTLIFQDNLLKGKLISESMFKYVFNKNIIFFNSVIITKQLMYNIDDKHIYDFIEITSQKSESGLSGIDKLEANATKIDEGLIILSNINIKNTLKKMIRQMHVPISKDEINFYMKHLSINKYQKQLLFYGYANKFGFRDLNLLTKKQYIKLLIILKKKMIYDNYIYLPSIMTGNMIKSNTRTIQNSKFLNKIENSSLYQYLIKNKFSTLKELNKDNTILNLLSILINSTFTFVEYDRPDLFDNEIDINVDILSDEFLNMMNQL